MYNVVICLLQLLQNDSVLSETTKPCTSLIWRGTLWIVNALWVNVCVCVYFTWLTAHEEEQACHILHEAAVPAAAEHADDPSEQDDGYSHAHEASRHPPQVWRGTHKHNSWSDSMWNRAQEHNWKNVYPHKKVKYWL